MDGITGTMVVFTDGDGTMLATQDFMVPDGVNHGDGTDGIDGTTGVMAVLDSDGIIGDTAGITGAMAMALITVMVMVTEIEITTETTVSLTEVMPSTIQEEVIIQDKLLITVDFLPRQQEVGQT
jgi:hypothetical protein